MLIVLGMENVEACARIAHTECDSPVTLAMKIDHNDANDEDSNDHHDLRLFINLLNRYINYSLCNRKTKEKRNNMYESYS